MRAQASSLGTRFERRSIGDVPDREKDMSYFRPDQRWKWRGLLSGCFAVGLNFNMQCIFSCWPF